MADELGRSLARLERTLVESGAEVVRRFRPGVSPSTVARLMRATGLTPSTELLEWFAWHDGVADLSADMNACSLAPGAVFYDLASLCDEYSNIRRSFDEVEAALPIPSVTSSDLWDARWFPLLGLWGGFVAVDLTDSGTASPVHVVWFDAEIEYRKRPLWPSMNAFVITVLNRIEDGTYWIDGDGVIQGPDVDQTR